MELSTIQNYIKDKKILLVGNGEHKEENLSAYNIVIRMNYGIQNKPADIWVNHLIQYNQKIWGWDRVDFKYMLRLNAENKGNRLLRGCPKQYDDSTYFWNAKDYLTYSKKVGCTQPFTGTTTLHWLTQYTKPKSISVIGMDFFKTHSYSPIHKPERDREYVELLSKKYNIIRLC
jgi:hypothetical protein